MRARYAVWEGSGMTTRRAVKTFGIASALVLALAGCVKMDINLDLQGDDTVDGHMTIAMSQALIEMSGEDPDTLVEQMQSDILDSDGELGEVRVEPYEDDDFVGSTTHFTGADLATFGSDDADSLSIVRDGDDFVVTGAMDLTGEENEQLGAMMGSFDIRIAITFPGAVAEHTGELEGRTVVWTPKLGERNEISARGSAVAGGGAGGLPMGVLLAVGLGVLALVVIVVLLVVRNRSRGAEAGAPALATADGATYAPAADAGTYAPGAAPGAPVPPAPGHGVPPVAAPPVDPVAGEASATPEAPASDDDAPEAPQQPTS